MDDHHQKTALGIVVAFPILGGIAVLLRLWSRSLSRSALTSGRNGPFSPAIYAICLAHLRIWANGLS